MKLRSGKAAHWGRRRSVAQENHAEIANGGLAGAGFATDVGGDTADDDRVDATVAKDQFEIGAVECAEAWLVEKDVVGINDESLCAARRIAIPYRECPPSRTD